MAQRVRDSERSSGVYITYQVLSSVVGSNTKYKYLVAESSRDQSCLVRWWRPSSTYAVIHLRAGSDTHVLDSPIGELDITTDLSFLKAYCSLLFAVFFYQCTLIFSV